MVGTIGPVVYGYGRRSRIILNGLYCFAQVGAAALLGFHVSLLGAAFRIPHLLGPVMPLAVGSFCLIGAIREFNVLPLPLPSSCWQVPRTWMMLPPGVMASCYGFIIGLGVLTRIPFSTFYVIIAACFVIGDPPIAASVMSIHALVQSGAVLLVTRSYINACDRIKFIHDISNNKSYIK